MNDANVFNHVFGLYVWIASVVFLAVLGLLTFSVVRYRAGRPHAASTKTDHHVLEGVYATIVAAVAVFLIIFSATANAEERTPLGKPQLRVAITAYQWCWSFHYQATPVTVSADCRSAMPTLVVPSGEVIQFSLTSDDVVHEWWLPVARYKEEAFPGHVNVFELRFTKLGHFLGRCSEFCGLYHDTMDFAVTVLPPGSFKAWLQHAPHTAATAGT